jgi:hypothetical protein
MHSTGFRLMQSGFTNRYVGMALEAVDLDRCINVTGVTEMLFAFYSGYLAFLIRFHMAVYTVGKTRRFATNTFMHGLITLMQDVVHVIFTHLVFWLNTFLSFRRLMDSREGGLCDRVR